MVHPNEMECRYWAAVHDKTVKCNHATNCEMDRAIYSMHYFDSWVQQKCLPGKCDKMFIIPLWPGLFEALLQASNNVILHGVCMLVFSDYRWIINATGKFIFSRTILISQQVSIMESQVFREKYSGDAFNFLYEKLILDKTVVFP